MKIRPAVSDDAGKMSDLLRQLVAAGKRSSPSDRGYALSNYIEDPNRIQCWVAEGGDGVILGLQSLKWAVEGNRFGAPVGWGIIGTHVSPSAARSGIGSRLFQATRQAAIEAGVEKIEAFIGADNVEGQAYYETMGFRTYRIADGAICKCYKIA